MLRKRLVVSLIAFLFLGLLSPAISTAQNAPSDGDKADSAETNDEKQSVVWERLIYLPYKQLKEVFEKEGATVFIPYLEYLNLWQKAGTQSDKSHKPPVSAVITESHYIASIDKNLARIEATYKIHVLGKAWAEVPIRFGNAAVGKLTSEGEKILLRGTGPGTYSLLLPEKGLHTVTINLTARIRTSPDGQSFDLDVPTAGITTFELVVPEADQSVELTPQLVAIPVEAGENQTRVKANLGSTPKISALWYPQAGIKPEMDLLASVNNYTQVSIQDGLIHTDAFLEYEVLRGELNQVRIVVPVDHRILGVSSGNAKIGEWSTNADEKRQVVTVKFLGKVEKKTLVEVHTEKPAPAESFDLAGITDDGVVNSIHALDAVRESGQFVVTHGRDITLTTEQQTGLIRIDAAEVYQPIRRPNGLYFKFYSPKLVLKISARPVQPRITVTHNTQLVIRDDELHLTADLQYLVERAGVFEFRLNIPDDLTIDKVSGAGIKEHNVDEDTKTLVVALDAKRQGAIQFTVSAHRAFDDEAEETEQTLPILEPVGTAREIGRVYVYVPEAIELISDDETLVGAQPEPLTQTRRIPNVRLASAWNYSHRPVTIPIKTRRKPTRLTATVATTINAKQELAEVTTRLTYTVQYAGIDTFRFAVPEAVADRVQIRSLAAAPAPAIKQKSQAEEAVDGWVTWTVIMQRDVTGQQPFEITYDLNYGNDEPDPDAAEQEDAEADDDEAEVDEAEVDEEAADEPAAASDTEGHNRLVVKPLQALGLDDDAAAEGEEKSGRKVLLSYVAGEIAIQKDRALAVSATPSGEELETIDVRELQYLPQTGYIAFRYYTQPVELTVETSKHEIQPVVETVISRALVEVVVGRDNKATYRARYRIKSSERQQLRVDLQEGAELLGQWVEGKSVSLEKNESASPPEGWESFFINVARTTQSDQAFNLTLQFQLPLEQLDMPLGSRELTTPRIGGIKQIGVAVQRLRVAVWIPDEFAVIGTPENFVRENPYTNLEQWIGSNSAALFDFPTEGRPYIFSSLGDAQQLTISRWRISFVAWVVSGAIAFIALVLRNTSWENKLSILVVVAFLATLYGLQDADYLVQGLQVAQYGLIAMLAIWLIHALFGNAHLRISDQSHSSEAEIGSAAAVIPPPGIFEMLADNKGKKS